MKIFEMVHESPSVKLFGPWITDHIDESEKRIQDDLNPIIYADYMGHGFIEFLKCNPGRDELRT